MQAIETVKEIHTPSAPPRRARHRCRLDAIRRATPYRSNGVDGHSRLLHPRPTVRGEQTAIVVGPSGSARTAAERRPR